MALREAIATRNSLKPCKVLWGASVPTQGEGRWRSFTDAADPFTFSQSTHTVLSHWDCEGPGVTTKLASGGLTVKLFKPHCMKAHF